MVAPQMLARDDLLGVVQRQRALPAEQPEERGRQLDAAELRRREIS